jgi:N-acetylglutamate synthase-like GNAT family acetyltransferase
MISFRAADVRDAPRLVSLMRELGYQVTPDLMAEKLRALMTSASDKIMVATADDALIGCVGCHVLELLHAPGRLGRITALVVASTHQRQGAGAGLVAAAEAFFRSLGCVRVEVTSGNHRAGAHAFYTSLGFSESNTRFIKSI